MPRSRPRPVPVPGATPYVATLTDRLSLQIDKIHLLAEVIANEQVSKDGAAVLAAIILGLLDVQINTVIGDVHELERRAS